MTRIANQLLKLGKKVIFATTTPVREPVEGHSNERIAEYNALIVPVLQEKGIIINDLYSVVYPHRNECMCEDGLHLGELAIDLCTEQTVKIIREVAKNL